MTDNTPNMPASKARPWDYRVGNSDSKNARAELNALAPEMAEAILGLSSGTDAPEGYAALVRVAAKLRRIGATDA